MARLRKGIGKHIKPVEITLQDQIPVARISLGNRKTTVISLSDISILDDHSFYAHKRKDGQVVARSSQTTEYLHRLIMQPEQEQEIDHINSDPLDNTRGNLRPCTTRQNNLAKMKPMVEGYHGVHQVRKAQITRIQVNRRWGELRQLGIYQAVLPDGKRYGRFLTAEAAARYRDEVLIDEYCIRECGEDFHTYGFIHWNDDHLEVQQAVNEMDDWITEQIQTAAHESRNILDTKKWAI